MKLFLLLTAMAAYGAPKLVKLQTVPASVALHGAKSGQQFLAIATYSDGTEADVTGDVTWKVSNAALAGSDRKSVV